MEFQNHVDGKSGGDKSHVWQSPRPEAEVVTINWGRIRGSVLLLLIVYSLFLIFIDLHILYYLV